jgi:hypothetical protein
LAQGLPKYTEIWDQVSATGDIFSTLANFPVTAIYAGSSGHYNGNIYYVGGESSSNIYKYNISTNTWSNPAGYTTNLYTWGIISHGGNDKIYSFNNNPGGGNGNGCTYYDTTSNAVVNITASPESGRRGRGIVDSTATYGYLQPGYTAAPDTSFYRYSVSGNSWSTMTDYPTTVYDIGIAYDSTNGTIYGLGGQGVTAFYQYNISTNTWTSKTTSGSAINGFGVGLNGKVWYLGDSSGRMRYYDPTTNTWTIKTATNAAVGTQVGHLINDGTNDLYIIANSSTAPTIKYQTK